MLPSIAFLSLLPVALVVSANAANQCSNLDTKPFYLQVFTTTNPQGYPPATNGSYAGLRKFSHWSRIVFDYTLGDASKFQHLANTSIAVAGTAGFAHYGAAVAQDIGTGNNFENGFYFSTRSRATVDAAPIDCQIAANCSLSCSTALQGSPYTELYVCNFSSEQTMVLIDPNDRISGACVPITVKAVRVADVTVTTTTAETDGDVQRSARGGVAVNTSRR